MTDKYQRDVKADIDAIVDKVMEGLTPFQRATVRAIDRLYKEHDQRRILVADEVGLGKTHVAKGAIAKVAQLRRDERDDLVKVVYICSNSTIADQNIGKLRIDDSVIIERASTTRLSMQHLILAHERAELDKYQRCFIQMIPLTPLTSFSLEGNLGNQPERALMYAVLSYDPVFRSDRRLKRRLKNLLWANSRENRSRDHWNKQVAEKEYSVKDVVRKLRRNVGKDVENEYPYDILAALKHELEQEEYNFDSIVEYLQNHQVKPNTSVETKAIIRSLRLGFSKASMGQMNPDFVIMDEFQRFRNLIVNDESELGLLVNRFLKGNIEQKQKTRVLLLSATPFRIFTTRSERDDDLFENGYSELQELIGFLAEDDEQRISQFHSVWSDYHRELLVATQNSGSVIRCLEKKDIAQKEMMNYLLRTERVSTKELGDQISSEINPEPVSVSADDIKAYFAMKDLAETVGANTSLLNPDYAKSCPFPLSFMRRYRSKELIDEAAKDHSKAAEGFSKRLSEMLWINPKAINHYSPLNVKHARYHAFKRDVLAGRFVSRLLWVPPSITYYEPSSSSPFALNKEFTKTLVFSNWAMVPPALASLISYEMEQENVQYLEQRRHVQRTYRYHQDEIAGVSADESTDTSVLPSNRLSMRKERANSFLLVYPSPYLAQVFNPLQIATQKLTLREVRLSLAKTIKQDLLTALSVPRLEAYPIPPNLDWYSYAVLKLDEYRERGKAKTLSQLCESLEVRNTFPDAYKDTRATLEIMREGYQAGAKDARSVNPPDDLIAVLVDAAIGSPAVCTARVYGEYREESDDSDPVIPFMFGHAFMTKMNTSDATLCVAAAMEQGRSFPAAHWKRLLSYCCEGNFQAMLDEYFSLTYDGDADAAFRAIIGVPLGNDKSPSLYKAETRITAETRDSWLQNIEGETKSRPFTLRCHYATGFMETEDSAHGADRRTVLRAAFNSPFRPFVLVSTSIGQEGLDFHAYCRDIVHWNLPHSPIDLEQREGRINRFKSHAVRQTLARRYGDAACEQAANSGERLWDVLFKIAEKEENESDDNAKHSGLLPYWGTQEGDDQFKIRRLVYNYPFSVDEQRYRYLLRSVATYRAVFGQPDQETVLDRLETLFGDTGAFGENFRELFINLCPLTNEG